VTGLWFSAGIPASSINKTDRHDKTESGIKHHNPNPSRYYLYSDTVNF
jgi:hypothetical protein